MKRALIAAAVLLSAPAFAQTVANGPYYAVPSWDQTLPVAQRFIVLANFNSQAVLDRETGLVWERQPSPSPTSLANATLICAAKVLGNRRGWRLPTHPELLSLFDPSAPIGQVFPAGHPFVVPVGGADLFWTTTAVPGASAFYVVGTNNALSTAQAQSDFTNGLAWCLRSPINAQ
jgi:hypothetical protein